MATVATEQHNISGTWSGLFWNAIDSGDVKAELQDSADSMISGRIYVSESIGAYQLDLSGALKDGLITGKLRNFASTGVTGLPDSGNLKAQISGTVILGDYNTSDGRTGKILLRRSPSVGQTTAAPIAQPAPFLYRGTAKKLPVPSAMLEPRDLRKLYELLAQKSTEAAELQAASLTLQAGQTVQQLDNLKKEVRQILAQLIVRIRTATGDWIGGSTPDPLQDDKLPDGVTQIEFDSGALYQTTFKATPNNSFLVLLDFTRPSILDMGSQPTANASAANITANDSNWANGLSGELQTFFRQTPTKRGWLHTTRSYDALLLLLGFPLSFYIVYHLDRVVRHHVLLPEALAVAMYVWLVVVVFFFFRILFNYARWAFPKMELDAPRQHRRAVAHRLTVSGVTAMILGALVKAALKLFLGMG